MVQNPRRTSNTIGLVFMVFAIAMTVYLVVPRMWSRVTATESPVQAAALVVATGTPAPTPTIYNTPTIDMTVIAHATDIQMTNENLSVQETAQSVDGTALALNIAHNEATQTAYPPQATWTQAAVIIMAGTPTAHAVETLTAEIAYNNHQAFITNQNNINNRNMTLIGVAVVLCVIVLSIIVRTAPYIIEWARTKMEEARERAEQLRLENAFMAQQLQPVQVVVNGMPAQFTEYDENNQKRRIPPKPVKPECLTPEIEATIAAYVTTTGLWNDDMRQPKVEGLTRVNLTGGQDGQLAEARRYYRMIGYLRATGNPNKPYEPTPDGLAYWAKHKLTAMAA